MKLARLSLESYNNSVRAFITYKYIIPHMTTVIAFRGTTLRDLTSIVNSRQKMVNESLYVHTGVYKRHLDMVHEIDQIVKNDEETVLTGHSLGGCQALVYADHLCRKYPHRRVLVVTFGSPPVTSKPIEHSNLRILRFETAQDVFPLLNLNRFVHSGRRICLPSYDSQYKLYKHHAMKEAYYNKLVSCL